VPVPLRGDSRPRAANALFVLLIHDCSPRVDIRDYTLIRLSPLNTCSLERRPSPIPVTSETAAELELRTGGHELALKKAGVDVTFRPIKGAGHGGRDFSSQENRKLIEAFFDKRLKSGA
jgi:hypothetical protein